MSGEPGSRTLAWFHCFSGIAGDMALGSLVDAGADLDEVRRLLERLPIGGWSLDAEPVLRCGIGATRVHVGVRDDSVVRTFRHIQGILEEAQLPARVRDRSMATFSALAEVEGRLHRRPALQVHFHEVGGHDTVVDVVGTAAALEVLGVETLTSSAVATGTGMVRTSHGVLPNPAPAVVRLLAGAPLWGRDLNVELTTPTGAAILAGMAAGFGPMPPMVVSATGFGAGSRELDDLPNCTQVVLGTAPLPAAESPAADGAGHPLLVLEANLDDATGETLAHAVSSLNEAGALDAWVAPVLMKKGRPGHVLSVLADPALAASLREVLASETGSFGVRTHEVQRYPARREVAEVEVEGIPVRVKVGPGRAKPEHADAARAARKLGMPLREVVSRAEAAWREQSAEGPSRRPSRAGPWLPAGGRTIEGGAGAGSAAGAGASRRPAPVVGMPLPDRGRRRHDPDPDSGA